MAKKPVHEQSLEERQKALAYLLMIPHDSKEKGDVIEYFLEVLTPSEVMVLSNRIRIAQLLHGGATYREVRDETGIGFQTITNVGQRLGRSDHQFATMIDRSLTQKKRKKSKLWYLRYLSPYQQLYAVRRFLEDRM